MKFRLVGRDFQSWKAFELKVSGFTVIVGSSNRGKSALIRALRGILRNQVTSAQIRTGEKTAELTLEVEEGPSASLTRNSKTTTYTIDGADFAKLANEVPQPLQALNLHSISVGTAKLDPTFAGQFDSQFMMDLTPAELNGVFGLFSSTEQLNQGKKAIGQSNAEINSQAKLLSGDIQAGNVRVAKITGVLEEFKALLPQYVASSQAVTSAQTAQTLLGQHRGLLRSTQALRKGSQMALPSTKRLDGWFRIGRLLRMAQRRRTLIAQHTSFTTPIQIGDWPSLVTSWTLLGSYLQSKRTVAQTPKPFKVTSGLPALASTVRQLKAYAATSLTITNAKADVTALKRELKQLHDGLHELTKDSVECPKCGYQFTQE
jgi:energy-coupling factor transporter ATP-binding protein EcfA2